MRLALPDTHARTPHARTHAQAFYTLLDARDQLPRVPELVQAFHGHPQKLHVLDQKLRAK